MADLDVNHLAARVHHAGGGVCQQGDGRGGELLGALAGVAAAQQRLAKLLSGQPVQVETFNSYCEKTLQRHGHEHYDAPVRMASFKEQLTILMNLLQYRLICRYSSVLLRYNHSIKHALTLLYVHFLQYKSHK